MAGSRPGGDGDGSRAAGTRLSAPGSAGTRAASRTCSRHLPAHRTVPCSDVSVKMLPPHQPLAAACPRGTPCPLLGPRGHRRAGETQNLQTSSLWEWLVPLRVPTERDSSEDIRDSCQTLCSGSSPEKPPECGRVADHPPARLPLCPRDKSSCPCLAPGCGAKERSNV